MWRSMNLEQKTHYVSITQKYNEHCTVPAPEVGPTCSSPQVRSIAESDMICPEMRLVVTRLIPPSRVGVVPRGSVGHGVALASSKLCHVFPRM